MNVNLNVLISNNIQERGNLTSCINTKFQNYDQSYLIVIYIYLCSKISLYKISITSVIINLYKECSECYVRMNLVTTRPN